MGTKAGQGIRAHRHDTLPFLEQFPHARVFIVVEALAMFDTGAIACEGNDHDGWFGSHLPLILDLYLGRDLHRTILLKYRVGVVLQMCGPATTASPAQEEIKSELRACVAHTYPLFNSSLTI